MLQAIVTTIPKPSFDSEANYRPISLLNLDIKIFSKLIADCNKALASLIHPEQVGFITEIPRDGIHRTLVRTDSTALNDILF